MAIDITTTPWLALSLQSMAVLRCCSPNATIIPRRICYKPMITACIQSKKPSGSLSFCDKIHQVYEDYKDTGILCYTDENGELLCEGLDEGPRLTWEDMENLSKERKLKIEEGMQEELLLRIAAADWRCLQAAVRPGKN